MPSVKEEDLVKKALEIFHKVKEGVESEEFSRQVCELFKVVENTPLKKLITLEDLRWALRDDMFFHFDRTIRTTSDEDFIARFKYTILTSKTYDFYIPIYCLYEFPKNIKLGFSTVVDFRDLPIDIQDYFTTYWGHRFTIDREYHHTKEEYVNLKKRSVFIHLETKANGTGKAIENARDSAEDALHVVRFLYQINFNIVDLRYKMRDNENAGGMEGIAGLPFIGGANYTKHFEKSFGVLTEIFTKANPNEIERKIINAVRIFGIQAAITNVQVRFVLLVASLESLLMIENDKDYILWKLAEKAAYVLGRNKRAVNEHVKKAYRKRSAFVHGSTEEKEIATENDIEEIQMLVTGLVWRLVEFLKNGYTQIQKKEGVKSINEYIEESKFGKV